MAKRGIPFRELRTRANDLTGPLLVSSRHWDGNLVSSSAATYTFPSANFLFAHPFIVPRNLVVDAIAVEVNTSQASSNVRAALYDVGDAGGFPGSLIVESASFDTSTTGTKTTAIDVSLDGPRVYWAVVQTNDATVGLEATLGGDGTNLGYATRGTNAASNGLQLSHTFGAFPDPYGTITFDDTRDDLPRVYLTVV